MATKTKTDKDYDPIEEALDIGYSFGRKEERQRQTPRVEAARRGGQRSGRATATKVIEQDRRERAAKADAQREVRRRRRDEELASARRGAFATGAAKAKRDAAAQSSQLRSPSRPARRSSGSAGAGLTAPSFSVVGDGGGGLDRTTSARIIVLIVGVSAVGSIAYNALHQAPTKQQAVVGNATVNVPTHLRSLGGVFVAGTICLIVNEVAPGLGLALAVALGLDVGIATFTGSGGVFNAIGGGLFGKTISTQPLVNSGASQIGGTAMSASQIEAWIAAHPGQVPHPNAGPNDYWNTFARNSYANAQKGVAHI